MLYSTPKKNDLLSQDILDMFFPHNFQDFNFSKTIHSLYDVYIYICIYIYIL